MAGELELAGVAIDAEGGHVVGSLVAAVEKLAGGVKAEAAWVVAVRPGFVDVGEVAGWADGEDGDAVVEPVAGVDEAAIG